MSYALFRAITERVVEIPYRRSGTSYRSHLQGSRTQEGSSVLDSWPQKMGPIICPETLIRNYYYSLRNRQEERSCQISLQLIYPVPFPVILTWMASYHEISMCFSFPHDCAMAQAVSRRCVVSEARSVRIALVVTISSAIHTHSSVTDPVSDRFIVSVGNAHKKAIVYLWAVRCVKMIYAGALGVGEDCSFTDLQITPTAKTLG